MRISVTDMYKIGIGPSSSHTMGPMKAAAAFVDDLRAAAQLTEVARVRVHLYGSLALTGKGHCTDRAVILGLTGALPDTIDPDSIDSTLEGIAQSGELALGGEKPVAFAGDQDLIFHYDEALPAHPNGMRFEALDGANNVIADAEFYSIGGGFIARKGEDMNAASDDAIESAPYSFDSAAALLAHGETSGLRIDELVWKNELTWRSESQLRVCLDAIWSTMQGCVERGSRSDGVLPGRLAVKRRAPQLFRELNAAGEPDPMSTMDWVNAWALAVNEENAAGGRVVTAPTNGAAGIVPSVLHFYARFHPDADRDGIDRFLLTSAAIGMLYKMNASISGAEMGCQGEVGVACSMAAAGLAAAQGYNNQIVENAAEIGMEHNLGLTCDPIGGLVQIPCIERNAMGAVKAINAVRIARRGDGEHKVSLDQVIETMRQTGLDMGSIYKETSEGGLAVNVIEC
ncbi:MAG: L-serine ammonia-lyase [Gammaproteobacteria bacterium]